MRYLKTYENFEQPEGTGTESFWEVEIDGNPVKVTLTELIDYIDGVVEIDPNEIKDLLIDTDRDPKRVDAADLDYPIILSMKNGEYKSIIDGQHRVVKALKDEVPLKAKILNLDDAPDKYKKIFDSKSYESLKINMQHLINFKTYRNSAVLEGFLSGDISEEEYFTYFDKELNEGLVDDFIGKMVGTVKNTLLGFLEKAIKTGGSIVDKVIGFMKKIKDKVLSFRDKHPLLFKIIMIVMMTLLILIISCVIAHAATTGNPIDENIRNLAIGFLDDMKTHGYMKNYNN